MIKVKIDRIMASLLNQQRVIVLKDLSSDRILPIWIGPVEADAITLALQGIQVARPLTHDLLKNLIMELGATVSHVLINDLHDNTFFARIVIDANGRHIEVDSRPSDAVALAVRLQVPIFVAEEVLAAAAVGPSREIDLTTLSPEEEERLSAFREFVNTLDFDEPEDEE